MKINICPEFGDLLLFTPNSITRECSSPWSRLRPKPEGRTESVAHGADWITMPHGANCKRLPAGQTRQRTSAALSFQNAAICIYGKMDILNRKHRRKRAKQIDDRRSNDSR
ncbi:hypothetical protein T06_784 [Trichinella sp. T6]|nr:hypothetical protein T06_799 [Trichinella sp. T6]KRX73051.1 hypothetical protein T06_784 [Trichinella sp. T6]